MSLSQKSAQQTHEAVLFFAGQAVSREMLYAEFEALLDCVVPMRDFAGKEQRAPHCLVKLVEQPYRLALGEDS